MKAGFLFNLVQWLRIFDDFTPIESSRSDLAVIWALGEIQKLKDFAARYDDFIDLLDDQSGVDPF